MRRGSSILLVAVLLAVSVAAPLALAKPAKVTPSVPQRLPLQPAPGAPAPQPASGTGSPPAAGDLVGLLALGGASAGLLALGLMSAVRAKKVRARRAPRKTYEAGRLRGRSMHAMNVQDAFRALADARVGEVLEAVPTPAGARIMVERPRSHTCEEVAGFLSGLFENVWATDVVVEHAVCAGKAGPCRYHVARAGSPILGIERTTAPAGRGEGASTPGWSAGRRRSPPARNGGG